MIDRDRDRARTLVDVYAALRAVGYTRLGAIRALRTLGVSLADARTAAETSEGPLFGPAPPAPRADL